MRGRSLLPWLTLAVVAAASPASRQPAADPIVIGSKTFTESYLLAEIMAQTLERAGLTVERRFGFGGTLITYEALRRGEIDLYPEYTGTISQVILQQAESRDPAALNDRLEPLGLIALPGFGFDNTYALVTREELAEELGLERISDLRGHDGLSFGFSHEFRQRPDGWPGLRRSYRLSVTSRGIEHGLAYQALAERKIDVTDAYSTDGDLLRFPLRILTDDRGYFPEYRALPLLRADLPGAVTRALATLADSIDAQQMRTLNARIVVGGESIPAVASDFLGGDRRQDAVWRRLGRNTLTHLQLTVTALAAAALVALTAAIAAYERRRLADALLYVSGLMQTIPSIALLALMIPIAGVGALPAIIALFLYSLLPILRNALTALRTVDPLLKRVAEAMGMTERERLRHVLLPLALPHVLAGIKTAAIISIGTATLAAFIGAGGLGEPIVTGLALNDTGLILQGAIPAAALALLTEFGFELLERRLVPAHMLASRLPA